MDQHGSPATGVRFAPLWLKRARYIIDRVTQFLNVIGTLLIVAIMVLVNVDVIGRGAFDAPVAGVPELVSMSIVAIVFLQIAQTFRMGRMTRTEALLNTIERRAPRLREAVEIAFCCLALLVMWELLRASWPLFLSSWTRNTYEGTIGSFTAPIWPVKLAILIGCVALIVQLVFAAIDAALRLSTRGRQP